MAPSSALGSPETRGCLDKLDDGGLRVVGRIGQRGSEASDVVPGTSYCDCRKKAEPGQAGLTRVQKAGFRPIPSLTEFLPARRSPADRIL